MKADIELAHEHSALHRAELLRSGRCGCFYCASTFAPTEISDWIDEGGVDEFVSTALCPRCGIDSVIGDAFGFPVTTEFLGRMRAHWF